MPRRLLVRSAERCGGAGSGPNRRKETGAHRSGLWVAAPHPVRPLSHTHPPRGALLDLATVRGLAAAPRKQGLLLWLGLQRRPRPTASAARPVRAPGRCSGARAALARDRGKRWNRPQIPPPPAPRTRRACSALPIHWDRAPSRALRTREFTAPPSGTLNLPRRGRARSTRAQSAPSISPPPCALDSNCLGPRDFSRCSAPFPNTSRILRACVSVCVLYVLLRRLAKSPCVSSVITLLSNPLKQ